MFQLHKYPFVRLLIPFMGGVMMQVSLLHQLGITWGFVACLLFTTLLLLLLYKPKRYSSPPLFGIAISLLFIALGASFTEVQTQQSSYAWSDQEAIYEVILQEEPQKKPRSLVCPVTVVCQMTANASLLVNRTALLYVETDSAAQGLHAGNHLLISSTLRQPTNHNNPTEFDYAAHLLQKGVAGIGYVDAQHWQKRSQQESLTLIQHASIARDALLNRYRSLSFSGDNLAVLSSITLGYKEELTNEIKTAYSVSGASHILAISGLHYGLIYTALLFLFSILDRWTISKRLKHPLIIICLWSFAFLAGLSPSIIRAAIMYSFLSLAAQLNKQTISLNSLAQAALAMLLYNPFYLYDVGFQLSFSAVAGIVVLYDWARNRIHTSHWATSYVASLIGVSLAAQLVVAPIILYHFNQFSCYFLLTNLVVIGLVTGVLYLAIPLLVLSFLLPWIASLIAMPLNGLLTFLNGFVRWIEQLPHSALHAYWSEGEVVLFYIGLFSITLWVMQKRRKGVLIALSCVSASFMLSFWHDVQTNYQETLFIYNSTNAPALHLVENRTRSYLIQTDSTNMQSIHFAADRFWKRCGFTGMEEIKNRADTDVLYLKDGLIYYHKQLFVWINSNRWNNLTSNHKQPVTLLYVSKGFTGKLNQLAHSFIYSQVVLDSSLGAYRTAMLEQECKESGIACWVLSKQGCFQLSTL